MNWARGACAAVIGAVVASGTPVSAQSDHRREVDAALQRIGAFVESFYGRAQDVVSDVRVRVRPMGRDLSPQGRARRLLYEMRVEWEAGAGGAAPEPIVMRDLLEADGRPPKPGDDLECTDPKLISPEPLAVFLPQRRPGFSFGWAGRDREAGRDAVMLDYRAIGDQPPTVEWDGSCVSVDLPGMTRGRVWADPESGEVLRLDEHLTGMFEFPVPPDQTRRGAPLSMIIERADFSIRYRPVEFSDPDETLMLPSSIEMMTVWRNAGIQRLFTTQNVSNYRRFVTGSRIIRNPNNP